MEIIVSARPKKETLLPHQAMLGSLKPRTYVTGLSSSPESVYMVIKDKFRVVENVFTGEVEETNMIALLNIKLGTIREGNAGSVVTVLDGKIILDPVVSVKEYLN